MWDKEEDECMVECLLSMHREGKWKSEGNFKNEYLLHVDSRLSYLKK